MFNITTKYQTAVMTIDSLRQSSPKEEKNGCIGRKGCDVRILECKRCHFY